MLQLTALQTVRVTPRVRPGRPTNAQCPHIIPILSDLSEIDDDIVRGEDGDGAGDDVEHGLYLET